MTTTTWMAVMWMAATTFSKGVDRHTAEEKPVKSFCLVSPARWETRAASELLPRTSTAEKKEEGRWRQGPGAQGEPTGVGVKGSGVKVVESPLWLGRDRSLTPPSATRPSSVTRPAQGAALKGDVPGTRWCCGGDGSAPPKGPSIRDNSVRSGRGDMVEGRLDCEGYQRCCTTRAGAATHREALQRKLGASSARAQRELKE